MQLITYSHFLGFSLGSALLLITPTVIAQPQTSPPAQPTSSVIELPTIVIRSPLPAWMAVDLLQNTPPPRPVTPPQPTPAQLTDRLWQRRFSVGGTAGLGSPLGWVGIWAEVNAAWFTSVNVGVGFGGHFGFATAFTWYLRPVRIGVMAPYLGLGFSANFTPSNYRANPWISAPTASGWFNPEIGLEFRFYRGLQLRLGLGYTVMLNTGDFTNREFAGYYGPRPEMFRTLGFNPVNAADAHDRGQAMSFLFGHIDLGFLFDL